MSEKVLLWGIGRCYQSRRGMIKKLVDTEVIEIIALVSKREIEELDGYRVIKKEDVSCLEYDRIFITAEGVAYESIMRDIYELGIAEDKIISISSYMLEHYEQIGSSYYNQLVENQIAVIKELLEATDEEVNDYKWMYKKITEYGIYPYDDMDGTDVCYSERGIMQIVDEFTRYCNLIANLYIESALEVGVFRGRSSYFMCALLQRKNPDLKYTMVDICDNLDSFDCYKKVLPALDKQIPSTSDVYKEQSFDFVFIDADHSYDGSIRDYYNVGQYAKKITCFHDIYAHEYDEENGGTVRMWKEVLEMNKEKECKIFSKYPDKWMGIGCILHC